MNAPLALVAVAALCGFALAGCGGDGRERAGPPGAADAIETAVRETEAAGTVAFRMEFRSSGGPDTRFDVEGSADFETDRERFRLEVLALPDVAPGTELEFYSDSGEEYFKPPGARTFRKLPASEESPVPNGVTDSLGALATDVREVTRAGSGSVAGVACARYRARLDGDRIAERADLGRSAQAERQASAVDDAPVSLCIDERDLLREFTVEFEVPNADGYTLRAVAELRDFGQAEPLPSFEEIR